METIYFEYSIVKMVNDSIASGRSIVIDFFPNGKIVKLTDLNIIGKAYISYSSAINLSKIEKYILTRCCGYAVLKPYCMHKISNIDEIKKLELGKVFPTLEDCFSYLLPTAEIVIDPFTKNRNLIWSNDFVYHITNTSINISLEYKEGRSCICFATKKDINIQKGDTVSLLFDSGRIIDFHIQKRVMTITEHKEKWFEACCEIYQEDIDLIINEHCCQYRITYCNNNKAPLSGDFVNNEYSPYDHDFFAAYAKHYLNELGRLVPDYQLPCRTVNSSVVGYSFNWCYVYLMRDNTNGYHKIGISNNPEYREKTLQSEKPSIELLACKKFPTRKIAEAIESALHTAYSQQRLRGEWFKLDDVDVAAIMETLK